MSYKIMKILISLLLIIIVLYLLFITIAPPLVDKDKNRVINAGPHQASQEATEFLHNLDFVADLHCDALLWNRNLTQRSDYGHVDFPRMREANVAMQAFTIVTKSPKGQNFDHNDADAQDQITLLSIGQGQPIKTWTSLIERTLYQCQKLKNFVKKDKAILIQSASDLEELISKRQEDKAYVGGMLGIEGAHCLEGRIENFYRAYDAGVRMLGPAHFFDNEMGGSAHGIHKGPLTEFGKEVLAEMQKRHMIVDLAHASVAVIDEILATYDGPILTSHTGVQGIVPNGRNLSDQHLRAIASKGGLVGIGYFPEVLGGETTSDVVKTLRYTVDLIGVDFVALGSDFDGSVTTPWDITGMGLLVEEMMTQGFAPQEIEAIMGGNVKRYLLKWLP